MWLLFGWAKLSLIFGTTNGRGEALCQNPHLNLTQIFCSFTGGSRGIGAATARLAAAKGYMVCINYLQQRQAAEAVVAAIQSSGGRAFAVQADVASEEEVTALFRTVDGFGKLTALVNNAGTLETQTRLDSLDSARLARVFATNVTGSFICAREAVRRMSHKYGGSGGAIVNVSSGCCAYRFTGRIYRLRRDKRRYRHHDCRVSQRGGGGGYPGKRGEAGVYRHRDSCQGGRAGTTGKGQGAGAAPTWRDAGRGRSSYRLAVVRRSFLRYRFYSRCKRGRISDSRRCTSFSFVTLYTAFELCAAFIFSRL